LTADPLGSTQTPSAYASTFTDGGSHSSGTADTIERTSEFAVALESLHRGEHTAVFGGAGTGKSTLVREFLRESERAALVVAPTGLAALNVGGHTIHRAFSFRPDTTLSYVQSSRYRPAKFAHVLRRLDTLIIDEVSMVRADLFDMIETSLRRFGPQPGKPFGGVQIVLVGDLYQLAPIVSGAERKVFDAEYEAPFFFAAEAYDPDAFEVVELTRVFRQQGDQQFVDILNDIRIGAFSDDARAALSERVDPDFTPPEGQRWLTLTTTRRVAEERNARALAALSTPLETLTASSWGDLQGFEVPVPQTLELKVGAQVMMATNDVDGRWVNGSVGEVVGIERGAGWFGAGEHVRVQIDGAVYRVEKAEWEVTTPDVIDDPDSKSGKRVEHRTVGAYSQFPMKFAWAVTIHKAQGQTLDRVVVDLGTGTFASGQLYVALSRCTSLEGMVLRKPVRSADLKTDARITEYLTESGPGEAEGLAFLDAIVVPGPAGEPPRVLELAATLDDGETVSTVVNPQTEVSVACCEHAIDQLLVPFAPLLPQAWEALAQDIGDCVPAGCGIDDLLALIEVEIRRCGSHVRIPRRGIDISGPAPTAARAGQRSAEVQEASADYDFAGDLASTPSLVRTPEAVGYRMDRTKNRWPQCLTGYDKHEAAGHLRSAAVRAGLSPCVRGLVEQAEEHLGVDILPSPGSDEPAGDLLGKGGRVHVAGPVLEDGRHYSVHTLQAKAKAAGLTVIEQPSRARSTVAIVHDRRQTPDCGKHGVAVPAAEFLAAVAG
jgi:ATP-dependent DNA helicase PIF1